MPAPETSYRPYLSRFQDPQGPGDQRPTAVEVIKDLKAEGSLEGKVVLIIGGTGGLGFETAKSLRLTGAKIFITARSEEKGQAAVKAFLSNGKSEAVDFVVMDLASLKSVRSAAAEFKKRSDRLDVLITNAGKWKLPPSIAYCHRQHSQASTGIMACPFSLTEDGHELQLGSNHFGHFLLFRLLESTLSQSATPSSPSRVIALSSAGHRFGEFRFDDMNFVQGYDPLAAYAQSKIANIWMCNSIERRHAPLIRGLSVHPGTILSTDITRHFQADTLTNAGAMEHFNKTGCDVSQGAATTVWAALEPRFNDYGGVHLAEVGEARLVGEGEPINVPAYAPYAYDPEGEERLWEVSCRAVGVGEAAV
jgi:NAD(P)-dependent dehydrogenase (short-subunit alcohol dehydrogenase family)